ncbi:NYN domain-containing protein [Achromobacter sp. SD115]|uniref:NYN domain-containing protein n=2 Tax=unclassified Achromobacter TaxID=2626865 RepID=UPI001A96EF3F|nr:NYN domain-containing protein [Achromobacter sp. SD115]MBO1017621.1 NYN domain-containing protein [Achromobacter sp. SD115]
MNTPNENVSMALFCDFENVALGVRDTKYQKFDIRPVLERLLLKGSIVVKKAYCDWERYKEFKAPMHEANFELIEIPHVRQSGKNSADIRLVVDALDFCYTKSHVNTFVIISGDSDFSPLVSKLRENNKKVIGVGVKQSTSDLLIANCDEFIFYDDLAREGQRAADARRDNRGGAGASQQRRTPDEERRRKEELEARKTQAVEMVAETFEALMAERGDSGKVWASALKDALKRRRPDFNESYYGFRAFGNLLDEAQSRGLLEVGREENAGTYVYRDSASGAPAANRAAADGGSRSTQARQPAAADTGDAQGGASQEEPRSRSGRKSRGGRKSGGEGRGTGQVVEQGASGESDAAPSEASAVASSPEVSETVSATPAKAPATTAAQSPAATQATAQADAARKAAEQAEAAKVDALRADALVRAQESKPVQPSRLPPMPKPLPQARQPLPAVNIAEWTFAPPAAESRSQPASKTPAKMSDPFEGGVARTAAREEAKASKPVADQPVADKGGAGKVAADDAAAGKPAAKRATTRSRTAAKKTTAEAAPADTVPATASEAPAKPARKTASKTASKAAPRARRASKTAGES